jgi:molybdopterin biosynthesis enzyme MoaB
MMPGFENLMRAASLETGSPEGGIRELVGVI